MAHLPGEWKRSVKNAENVCLFLRMACDSPYMDCVQAHKQQKRQKKAVRSSGTFSPPLVVRGSAYSQTYLGP